MPVWDGGNGVYCMRTLRFDFHIGNVECVTCHVSVSHCIDGGWKLACAFAGENVGGLSKNSLIAAPRDESLTRTNDKAWYCKILVPCASFSRYCLQWAGWASYSPVVPTSLVQSRSSLLTWDATVPLALQVSCAQTLHICARSSVSDGNLCTSQHRVKADSVGRPLCISKGQ